MKLWPRQAKSGLTNTQTLNQKSVRYIKSISSKLDKNATNTI